MDKSISHIYILSIQIFLL